MKIIIADFIYTPEGFVENKAVAFEQTIQDINTPEALMAKYQDAQVIHTPANSVLYPGFINTHVHLEFSSNKTSLTYGSFKPWLDSVIEQRDTLLSTCDNAVMMKACTDMMHSGITTFGAVSSFGNELEVCEKTPQRVVFFNELIGSNAMYADVLYGDFLERIKASQSYPPDARITPAVAIHSPYAVHPVILQKAVSLAKKHHMPLSAHFLESQSERQWLESNEGELKTFFQHYFNASSSVTTIEEFIHAFDSHPTHFIHCVHANKEEIDYLASKGHSVAHCPRSNRYLGCGRLAIEMLKLPFSVATDGLSSNDSLSLFDELRAALMLHHLAPLDKLANKLIRAVTSDAADILNLNCGKIAIDTYADFAIVTLPDAPKRLEDIALWTILHTKEISALYINGEKIEGETDA